MTFNGVVFYKDFAWCQRIKGFFLSRNGVNAVKGLFQEQHPLSTKEDIHFSFNQLPLAQKIFLLSQHLDKMLRYHIFFQVHKNKDKE